MDTSDAKKEESVDIYSMLKSIMERLDRIEALVSRKQSIRLDVSDSESEADSVVGEQDYTTYESDSDDLITLEPSYDSDHDRPIHPARRQAECEITLTPLQIQLANEEFMQYKNDLADPPHDE